ncbi:MAG: tRNA (guanosine(37)-N1)-methyltransferase TrmD [Candidatus Tectomicrobia bacterium]|nr:tRNA (guanosine(37)-N1)-methyltransferase TrmD [Candidatus Tectomicrobia bacterium]
MRFDVLTVLPGLFEGVFREGVLGRAVERGVIEARVWSLRDFAEGAYRQTDDTPYGGGAGMVMKPEPIVRAVEAISAGGGAAPWRVLLSPQGRAFGQAKARELAGRARLLLICGRYEGVDDRVRALAVDEELSIGDYVLSGGEVPAMAVADAVARLLPGVLGNEESALRESFSEGLLDHPHYTRPPEFRGLRVPEVLLTGNHEAIRRWRRGAALRRTREFRRDLFERAKLTGEDLQLLESSS